MTLWTNFNVDKLLENPEKYIEIFTGQEIVIARIIDEYKNNKQTTILLGYDEQDMYINKKYTIMREWYFSIDTDIGRTTEYKCKYPKDYTFKDVYDIIINMLNKGEI